MNREDRNKILDLIFFQVITVSLFNKEKAMMKKKSEDFD
jgi:hypothetical protein